MSTIRYATDKILSNQLLLIAELSITFTLNNKYILRNFDIIHRPLNSNYFFYYTKIKLR